MLTMTMLTLSPSQDPPCTVSVRIVNLQCKQLANCGIYQAMASGYQQLSIWLTYNVRCTCDWWVFAVLISYSKPLVNSLADLSSDKAFNEVAVHRSTRDFKYKGFQPVLRIQNGCWTWKIHLTQCKNFNVNCISMLVINFIGSVQS